MRGCNTVYNWDFEHEEEEFKFKLLCNFFSEDFSDYTVNDDTAEEIKIINATLNTALNDAPRNAPEGLSLKDLVQDFEHKNEEKFQRWLRYTLNSIFPEYNIEQISIIIYCLKGNGPIDSLKISKLLKFTTRTAAKRCKAWLESDFLCKTTEIKSTGQYNLSNQVKDVLSNISSDLLKEGFAVCANE